MSETRCARCSETRHLGLFLGPDGPGLLLCILHLAEAMEFKLEALESLQRGIEDTHAGRTVTGAQMWGTDDP